MKTAEYVSEALAPLSTFEERHGAVAVRTSCLYPSNAAVTVYVRGGPIMGAIVSDDGRAIDELTACNRDIQHADKFLSPFCRRAGLVAENGKIRSPRIEAHQLASAVAFVANASANAVSRGLALLRPRSRSTVKEELEALLNHTFPIQHIERSWRIEGESTRTYKFDTVIKLDNRRILLIDPVSPDPNSINAHAIAHLDVGRLKDSSIAQRLVYDDHDNWKSSELSLLQMAAPIVPLSHAEKAFDSFRIQL